MERSLLMMAAPDDRARHAAESMPGDRWILIKLVPLPPDLR